ncbi:MAG: hypothetical protein GXO35_07685 [Gammaproteobacteria bacterium]|nr:hypothetical protein [Gammaproteobacteria bacterium]
MNNSIEPYNEASKDLFGDHFTATMDEMLENLTDLDMEDLKLLWPARLVEFYEILSHCLSTVGEIQDEQNNKLSAVLVTAIANHFGGVSFYLPHNQKLERAIRDIKIWKAFTGNNHQILAKKFRVSEMTIRTALANQHRIRHNKIQPSLFQD